jgi:hypothetical protein
VMEGTATEPVTSLANELVNTSITLHDSYCSMGNTSDILTRLLNCAFFVC